MARKIPPVDMDDVIRRYLGGESPRKIAPTIGVSEAWVNKQLAALGVMRSAAEAALLRRGERPETADKIAEAIRMRAEGLTQREIGDHFGTSQAVVSRWLLSRGQRTDLSAAVTRRMASMTSTERRANATAAHDAVRGVKRSHAELVLRAKSRQERESHATDEERRLGRGFERAGLSPVLQQAVDKYNLDFGIEPVAVELFGGNWHAHGRHLARLPKRVHDIADAGFNLLIFWTHRAHPLNDRAVTDETVAYFERSRSDPTFRRQYRVVWGDGQFIAEGCVDDDDLALVPSGIRSDYARRG